MIYFNLINETSLRFAGLCVGDPDKSGSDGGILHRYFHFNLPAGQADPAVFHLPIFARQGEDI